MAHAIDPNTDEVVLCKSGETTVILKFDVSAVVWDSDSKRLGSFHMLGENEDEWVFYKDVGKREGLQTFTGIDWLRNTESLIDAEVKFSKLYLENKESNNEN